MITAYLFTAGSIYPNPIDESQPLPAGAVWIDLLNPTPEEVRKVDAALKIVLPSREEMAEIEFSSRIYQEDGAVYLTATVITRADTEQPESTPITFVLAGHVLITMRYAEPQPFRTFATQIVRHPSLNTSGEAALSNLLDTIIDRVADVLERIHKEVDGISNGVFAQNKGQRLDYESILKRIGKSQTLTSKARDSLVSLGRILSFVGRPGETKQEKALARNLATLSRDVMSLSDHATYLSNNISFLLDATLGLISSEQNGIIKIFSVAAVVFLPPTLIASIYGMNFHFMPELDWVWGYPLAIIVMIMSAVLPYWFFKRRRWL
ncbi:MAG: magnesium/cobalt transporter CorA [Sphingomonadales bacterium]|nr:magnesium/cobalt transporter CorA [Sphingomonadales bacterium]